MAGPFGIDVVLHVEVDPDEWELAYGVDEASLTDDAVTHLGVTVDAAVREALNLIGAGAKLRSSTATLSTTPMAQLAHVAERIGAKVECLGGNVYGAVLRHDDPVNAIAYEVVVTVEGDIWTVTRCSDPDGHDAEHDHQLHDASIAPVMHASDVPAAVTLLVTAVTAS